MIVPLRRNNSIDWEKGWIRVGRFLHPRVLSTSYIEDKQQSTNRESDGPTSMDDIFHYHMCGK